MAAVELHLIVTYAQHLALKSFYDKSQSVMGGNFFSSYITMFEVRDSKASDLSCLYEALVQKKTLIICHDRVFTSLLCVLSLPSVLGRLIPLCYVKFKIIFYKFLFQI